MNDSLELIGLLCRILFSLVLYWLLFATAISTIYFFFITLRFALAHRKPPP